MNDQLSKWIVSIATPLFTAAILWIGASIIDIKATQRAYSEVVPKPVEDALRELRDKTNNQGENTSKALAGVSNVVTDVGNVKERLTRLENKPQ
jgi:hypothetical protein